MLINELWKIPFLRFILPFIAGILASNFLEIPLSVSIVLAVFFLVLSIISIPFFNHNLSYHKRWIFGLLISFSLFFIATYLTVFHNQQTNEINHAEKIIAWVKEPPKETAKSVKVLLKSTDYQENNIWRKDNSNLLFYLEKNSLAKNLQYGDLLLLDGNLQEIKNAGNPQEFNYKKYLNRKQIYFQSYLRGNQWKKISTNRGNIVYSFAYKVRNDVLTIYKNAGIKNDEFAILAALTLGVKDYLSDEIVEAYSDSGAMHVLAVSGLHVGILAAMLHILLLPLRKSKKLRLIQSILIIGFLWFFALITGLAPSVTRSALMFTFFIMGVNSGKKPSSYNSLAAAAFIILVVNPNALFHVGFQLSFLAVISILFFQPKIYRAVDIKNNWLDKIWQLTTVSIAAQIGTTPISIFYFHQFPIYALLTNIIVIPAAAIILYGTVLLIFSSFYLPLAKVIGFILSIVLKVLNLSTKAIENLPFASIEYISIDKIELFLFYGVFFLLIIYVIKKQKKVAFAILLFLIGAFGLRAHRFLKKSTKKQLIVFNTNNHSSIAFHSGKKMTLYADSIFAQNKKSINYLTSNIRTHHFISSFELKEFKNDEGNNFPVEFLSIDSIKVAYLKGKTDGFKSTKKLKVNYLIFSKDATLDIEDLQLLFDFDRLIIDSSVPKWKQEIIEKDCMQKKVLFHNISKNGAFVTSSS